MGQIQLKKQLVSTKDILFDSSTNQQEILSHWAIKKLSLQTFSMSNDLQILVQQIVESANKLGLKVESVEQAYTLVSSVLVSRGHVISPTITEMPANHRFILFQV